jgi:hypothetical protein
LSYEVIVAIIVGPQLEILDGEAAGFGAGLVIPGFTTGFAGLGITIGFAGLGFTMGFAGLGFTTGFAGWGFTMGFLTGGEPVKTAERHPLQAVDPLFPLLSQQVPPA